MLSKKIFLYICGVVLCFVSHYTLEIFGIISLEIGAIFGAIITYTLGRIIRLKENNKIIFISIIAALSYYALFFFWVIYSILTLELPNTM